MLDASPSLPPSKRPRANSLPPNALSRISPKLLPRASSIRAFSCTSEHKDVRVCIAYTDDELCTKTLVNLRDLLRAAKQDDYESTTSRLAKKALQYRHKLERVQATDIEDPAFDVARFMGVSWRKVE